MAFIPKTKGQDWWKTATVYQIYPASFMDSNNDGIGDLPGILSKLDYVKSLGVDAVWISPFYASPNEDQGYDISDYQNPAPEYGKLSDVEAIIKGCHDRGLAVLFDLVINHTSDQHRWFQEARKSKDNPYRKYYIWREARYTADCNRIEPSNWLALFGGSAWEWDDHTREYYLHCFLKSQPDLNWEDEEVRKAIYKESIEYWLEKGVDGMRIDVANLYSKWPVEDVEVTRPGEYLQPAATKYVDGPRLVELTKEMTAVFAKYGAVSLAECPSKLDFAGLLKYVSAKEKMYNLAITFDVLRVDSYGQGFHKYRKARKLSAFKQAIAHNAALVDPKHDGWACNHLESHDQARSISRFLSDAPEHREISSKTMAILLLSLSGTPIIYQGQELGCTNLPKDWPLSEYIDPPSQMQMRNVKAAIQAGNTEVTLEGSWASLQKCARDHSRTPMQWSGEKGAGFSLTDKTWMRINDNYTDINVEYQEHVIASPLTFWRKMLAVRKQYTATMIGGTFQIHDASNEATVVYTKHSAEGDMAILLNFTGNPQRVDIPYIGGERKLLVTSARDNAKEEILMPYEGRIYTIKGGMRVNEEEKMDIEHAPAGPVYV